VLIEAKTMRMKGHAQHDPAEYVPKAMFDFWKAQDPITRYEKYLTEHKLWDAAKKSEIDARIERELDEEQKFAEESPMPPPELAEQGVYCDGCHTIAADWRRPKEEVMPPAASIEAVWNVKDFGAFSGNGAKAPTASTAAKPVAEDLSHAAPIRVPFGRGPKDRSVELERRDKPSSGQTRHKPHKRRRR
jgi:hypothetical protein